MEGLNPQQQERLDKWRKNASSTKNTDFLPGVQKNFVSRRGDYGDDFRDYEQKEQAMWRRNDELMGK